MAKTTPSTQRQTDQDRVPLNQFERNITKWILGVLASFYFVIMLAQISVAAGWLNNAPINSLLDSYKGFALPIITLALGHYFGSRSR